MFRTSTVRQGCGQGVRSCSCESRRWSSDGEGSGWFGYIRWTAHLFTTTHFFIPAPLSLLFPLSPAQPGLLRSLDADSIIFSLIPSSHHLPSSQCPSHRLPFSQPFSPPPVRPNQTRAFAGSSKGSSTQPSILQPTLKRSSSSPKPSLSARLSSNLFRRDWHPSTS